MSDRAPRFKQFRHRLKHREHLLGTFLKTPTTHSTEMLGSLGYDFVIIDGEHAPYNMAQIDMMVLAARAADIAALVRVSEATPGAILSVLDCGATGILVPHVNSVARAKEIADACRYRGGRRGFANTTRAGGFGDVPYSRHIAEQDDQVTCVAMIEDHDALDHLAEIASVPGLDAFFIGRGDLTAALGQDDQTNPQTRAAVERIMAAARAADMPTMVLPSNREDAAAMHGLGASAYILSNDHSLFKRAARDAMKEYAAPL